MNRLSRVEIPVIVGGQILQLSLSFVSSIMIAKMLSSEGYGIVNLVRSLYLPILTVAPLGLDVALLKLWGRRCDSAELRAVTQMLRGLAATLTLFFVLGFALGGGELLAKVYRYPDIAWLALGTLLSLPFACDALILGAIYKARGMAAHYALAWFYLQPTLRVALVILAWRYAPTVAAVTMIYPLQLFLCYLALRLHGFTAARELLGLRSDGGGPVSLNRGRWEEVASVLRESLWMCLSMFVAVMMRGVDILFVGYYGSAKSLGEYSLLATIAQLIMCYPLAASQSLGSNISRLYHIGALGGIERELSRYMRRASVIAGFLFAGIAAFGTRLDLLFGRSFEFGAAICILLPLAQLLGGTLGATGFALSMTGKHREESCIVFAGLVIFIIACAIFTPLRGAVGAAAAATFCYVSMNIARFAYVARHIGFLPGSPKDLTPPAIGLALAFAARTIGDHFGARDILTTALSAGFFTAAYVGVMALLIFPRGLRERLGTLVRGAI